MQLRHAKVADYLRHQTGEDSASYLKNRWRFHYFRLDDLDGQPCDSFVDVKGITAKGWTIQAPRAQGFEVIREMGCHVARYSRFRAEDDRVDARDGVQANILVPTGFFELVVVVDVDLYRHTKPAEGQPKKPSEVRRTRVLKGGLANLEGEDFPSADQWHGYVPLFKLSNGVWPDGNDGDDAFRRALLLVKSAQEASERFVTAGTADPRWQHVGYETYELPSLPAEYFVYVLQMEDVDPGDRIIVSWPLPSAR